ncbi:MAG: DUF192 domain-containing protein [Deltaproteobacteria bacterium]|nr:DUF192 domain-containing protein [Deltaproteobacteria bacterium]
MRTAALAAVVVALGGCPTTAIPEGPAAREDAVAGQHASPSRAGAPRGAAKTSERRPQSGLATGVVIVEGAGGPQRFRAQLAVTPEAREKGLMFVEHLDDDAGMIFFFERQQQLSFWMKNTYIPLDMLFIDEDLVVKGIVENAEPLTTTSRRIEGPTRFVLELRGGTARRLGLAAGDRVRFEGVPAALWQKTTPVQELR